MDPFLWNYVLEKWLEEDSSVDESDSECVQSLERNSPSISGPPLTTMIICPSYIPIYLTPLVMVMGSLILPTH
jgi:hypothetical protein